MESLEEGGVYSESTVSEFTDGPGSSPSDGITVLGPFKENQVWFLQPTGLVIYRVQLFYRKVTIPPMVSYSSPETSPSSTVAFTEMLQYRRCKHVQES